MLRADLIRLTVQSIVAHRMRSALTALGIGIGVTAVVLLTSIGEGVNRYVVEQFTQFGTTTLQIQAGKANTLGVSFGFINSVRPLGLGDAEALLRAPYVRNSVPVVVGSASIEAAGRERSVSVFAVGPDYDEAFRFNVEIGEFLPHDDLERARAVAVIGSRVHQELYDGGNPIGDRVRIGGSRFRVIGVMESKGITLGFDLDDAVYIPAASGLELFDREGLLEIDVLYAENAPVDEVVSGITRILVARHGSEDFTITTQQQMLDVLDSVVGVLTLGVAALGGISLLVGGVGIFTIMTIAVRERTAEIGLLRAVGATRRRIWQFFLSEAMVLSGLGGLLGLAAGFAIVIVTQLAVPGLPVRISVTYAAAAEGIAIVIGLLAGFLPAHRAAELEPLDALRTQ